MLSDGTQIRDPGGAFGGVFGQVPPLNELKAEIEDRIRENGEHARTYGGLARALRTAGMVVTPADLQALPLQVEFVDVDEIPPAMTDAEIETFVRRMRITAVGAAAAAAAGVTAWLRRRRKG